LKLQNKKLEYFQWNVKCRKNKSLKK
jgi:hypothetical protein